MGHNDELSERALERVGVRVCTLVWVPVCEGASVVESGLWTRAVGIHNSSLAKPHSEMSLGPSGLGTGRWSEALSLGTLEGN